MNWLSDQWWPSILFACFHPVFLFFFTRPFWRIYKTLPHGGTFRFHLLDLMTGSIALAPSLYCLSEAVKAMEQPNPSGAPALFIIGFLMLLSQACGFVIGRAHNLVPTDGRLPNQWVQSGWIFLGMLFGLVLLAMSAIVLGAILLLSPLSPLLGLVLMFGYLVSRWQKR